MSKGSGKARERDWDGNGKKKTPSNANVMMHFLDLYNCTKLPVIGCACQHCFKLISIKWASLIDDQTDYTLCYKSTLHSVWIIHGFKVMTKTKNHIQYSCFLFFYFFFLNHSNTLRAVLDVVHLCANAFTLRELITLMHVKNVRTTKNKGKKKKTKDEKTLYWWRHFTVRDDVLFSINQ